MKRLCRVGADAALLAHFAFVLFAVFGAVAWIAGPAWPWIHVPVVVWSSLVNLAGWTCPFTPLENALRRRAGGASYEGGFVMHYIGPLVYPGGMPRRMEWIAGVSIVAWNALVYGVLWLWPGSGASAP